MFLVAQLHLRLASWLSGVNKEGSMVSDRDAAGARLDAAL
jgi:hypothetical protein